MESIASKITNGEISIEAWQIMQTATCTARHSTEVLEKLTNLLKKNRFNWTEIEFQKVFNKLSKTLKKGDEVIGETIDGEILKAKIGDMLSENELLDAIKAMDNLATSTNAESVLKELCCESDWKFAGAEMTLRYLQRDNIWNKVKVLDKPGGGIIRVEIKSWVKIYKKSFLAQFAKDLDAVNNLNELLWIFDNKYGINFKKDITDVLTSPEGIAKLREIVREDKLKRFFSVQDKNGLDHSAVSDFISNNFNKVFSTR